MNYRMGLVRLVTIVCFIPFVIWMGATALSLGLIEGLGALEIEFHEWAKKGGKK